MIAYIVIGLLVIITSALSYLVYNLNKKVSIYEQAVQEYYETTSITLHIMRSIDERQMFENDDEVGEVFRGLVEAASVLYPLIYGVPDGEEEN